MYGICAISLPSCQDLIICSFGIGAVDWANNYSPVRKGRWRMVIRPFGIGAVDGANNYSPVRKGRWRMVIRPFGIGVNDDSPVNGAGVLIMNE